MTKREMEALTRNRFSRNSIRDVNGEMTVVGKYCRCTYNGADRWDIWVCNHENIAQGLSERKIAAIDTRISQNTPEKTGSYRFAGEGAYLGIPTDKLLLNGPLLGIKGRSRAKGDLGRLGRQAQEPRFNSGAML